MRKNGFTLIEITIALLVLAVGLVGLLSLFPVGFDASRRAADVTVATFLAQEKLEEAKRLGFDNYASLASVAITPFPAPYDRFSYTITVVQNPPPMTGLKEVQVAVSWPAGGGGTRSIDLKTYVADYGP